MLRVSKIVSGGQTGADRAALDFALANNLAVGGFVPAGRTAEDGPLSAKYRGMTETGSPDPSLRTELNVFYSDATLVVTRGDSTGGSALTAKLARHYRRPLLHIDLARAGQIEAARSILGWLRLHDVRVLNVAGPRASEDPGIYAATLALLERR